MRRFDFLHAVLTSLGRPRRATKRLRRAAMAAAAIVGTSAAGPTRLARRAATLVAHAHAYRHTGARQNRADGSE
jgi:hypothetical protein